MEKIRKKLVKYFPWFFLTILVLPATLPLFRAGFFTMHDDQQVIRLSELDQALKAGQFPPRWVANLGFGFGYPLFIFYPPFVYYLGELFHLLLGASFIISIKLVFGFAFLAAALAMYIWAKEHFSNLAALVAAAFYTYVPYHAVNAYVRGALAELTAFVWLPLVLWSTDKLILKKDSRQIIWLAVFLALLMITHNLIFLSFLPLFALYILFLLLRAKNKLYVILTTLSALLLSAGFSAFFWLPALLEKKHTLVDNILLSELAEYKLHFVYPSQLWNSLWGYAGSTAGALDGLSLKIGKLHIISSFMAALLWLVIYKLKKLKENKSLFFQSLIILLLFISSALMTTSFSQSIWDLFTPLQYLQFPWRYLIFTACFSSLLSGSLIAAVSNLVKNRALRLASTFVILVLLFYPNLKLFKPQTYLDVSDDYYLSDEFIKWRISKTSFEFLPKGIITKTEFVKAENKEITQVDINQDQISSTPYYLLEGKGNIKVTKATPGKIWLNTQSNNYLNIQLNTVDFPGWQVEIDGEAVKYSSDNAYKLINIKVPEGNHFVKANFKNTPIRSIANFLTLLSFFAVVVCIGLFELKAKKITREALKR